MLCVRGSICSICAHPYGNIGGGNRSYLEYKRPDFPPAERGTKSGGEILI